MKISSPERLQDFKLKHAARLMSLSETTTTDLTFSNILQHVSSYTDVPVDELKNVKPKQIMPIFNNCLAELNKYEKKEPLKEMTILGKEYVLININDQKAGWLIDVELNQEHFKTQPEKMVALCYIEKGKQYGEVKTSEREKIFQEHFPAYLFFDLNAFFLFHYLNYTTASAFVQKIRAKKMLKKEMRKARIKKILGIMRKN